jgi:hypothetical protein
MKPIIAKMKVRTILKLARARAAFDSINFSTDRWAYVLILCESTVLDRPTEGEAANAG